MTATEADPPINPPPQLAEPGLITAEWEDEDGVRHLRKVECIGFSIEEPRSGTGLGEP